MIAPIYLDNNATTRPAPEVVEAMVAALTENWANPSSGHLLGAEAAQAVERARRDVAELIGARPADIVFTSGGTEADNGAMRGVLAAQPGKRHLIISAVEHHAIVESAEQLEREGYEVTRIGVDSGGRLDLESLKAAIRPDTGLISIMLANNETGVVFPVAEVSDIARRHGVPMHTDAVNALGKIPVDVESLGVDLLSLSGHKIYGPKGAGALYVREGTPLRKWQIGGSQERGRRGGTLATPGIVGLGVACRLVREQPPETSARIAGLRDRLEGEVLRRFSRARVVGGESPRLPNTSCVCFEGLVGATLVVLLSEAGVCVSSGAACAAGAVEPSHVLRAMGVPAGQAAGEIRFSLGRLNTEADVEGLFHVLAGAIAEAGSLG